MARPRIAAVRRPRLAGSAALARRRRAVVPVRVARVPRALGRRILAPRALHARGRRVDRPVRARARRARDRRVRHARPRGLVVRRHRPQRAAAACCGGQPLDCSWRCPPRS